MPWKECHVMDERLRFIARLLEGEKMAAVCADFGIARKTGYKIFERYQQAASRGSPTAVGGPSARQPAPDGGRNADRPPEEGVSPLGCPEAAGALETAVARRNVSRDQHGPCRPRSAPTRASSATASTAPADRDSPDSAVAPNRLWCADYKGEFLLANRRYCYPLTITDFASRYLIACEAQSTTKERYAFAVFERAFQDFGLPDAIRTDNGVPFALAHALYGLSKLAVWWLRLDIGLERIAPGHPEQNGRHERLHLTLKTEATHPAAPNILQQQARFDTFLHRFNEERPHQALDMRTPASQYAPSTRSIRVLRNWNIRSTTGPPVITTCGRICYQRRKINVSQVFAGQKVGVKQVDEHIWLVTFMDYDLDISTMRPVELEPMTIPSARNCYPCLRNELLPIFPE